MPAEDDPVEEVDRFLRPRPRRDDLADRRDERPKILERQMAQADEGRHRFDVDGERDGIPEGAVGVGEGAVELRVGPVRGGGDDLPGPDEDVHRADRLVRQAVAEAARFDAQPGHRAAEGDGAQLRDDQRHDTPSQGRLDESLVGRHALHGRRPRVGVDVQHGGEAGAVQSGPARGRPGSEEIGRPFGQPGRLPRIESGVTVGEQAHGGPVFVVGPGRHRDLTSSRAPAGWLGSRVTRKNAVTGGCALGMPPAHHPGAPSAQDPGLCVWSTTCRGPNTQSRICAEAPGTATKRRTSDGGRPGLREPARTTRRRPAGSRRRGPCGSARRRRGRPSAAR